MLHIDGRSRHAVRESEVSWVAGRLSLANVAMVVMAATEVASLHSTMKTKAIFDDKVMLSRAIHRELPDK